MEQKKILYAENNLDHLDDRSEFLENEGYQVVKACNPDEVIQAFERENIHIAILDIRLVDDNDEGDDSGILLAKDNRFKAIPKIFVTGFPTFAAVREARGSSIGDEPIAETILDKAEGPEVLIEAVHSVFEKVVGINWDLKIVWDEKGMINFPSLVMLLDKNLDLDLLDPRTSELKDLFRKLFFNDEQISITQLNWVRNNCACLSLFAFSKDSSRQMVVIFGHKEAVAEQHKLVGNYLAIETQILSQPIFFESLHFAGLAFSVQDTLGGPLQNGPSFFLESGDRNVRLALENLFKLTLHEWHGNERSEINKAVLHAIYRDRLVNLIQSGSLEEVYRKIHFLVSQARTHSLIKEISSKDRELKIVFANGGIFRGRDPMVVLFEPKYFNEQSVVIASTFGGISANSLLIDQENRIYPTDFSSITRSPVHEDFISIECEFHFGRIGSYNLDTLWDFEKQLGESKNMNDLPPIGNVEPDCRKELAAIQTVRKLAAETGGDNLEPYLIGLFYYTMRPLLLIDPNDYLAKFQIVHLIHRLMTASLILSNIEKLNNGDDGVKSIKSEESGLKINEASRKVSVDGREIKLTQTEFKLLLHLYKKSNCLCTRKEILSEVFDIKGPPTLSDKGLLNTHLDRLRKKIDLNRAKHRYLVTIRGEGYRLDLESSSEP